MLLHGLFLHRGTWDAVVDEVSSEFQLVTPDFPGFGESEKPSQGRFAYDVVAADATPRSGTRSYCTNDCPAGEGPDALLQSTNLDP